MCVRSNDASPVTGTLSQLKTTVPTLYGRVLQKIGISEDSLPSVTDPPSARPPGGRYPRRVAHASHGRRASRQLQLGQKTMDMA